MSFCEFSKFVVEGTTHCVTALDNCLADARKILRRDGSVRGVHVNEFLYRLEVVEFEDLTYDADRHGDHDAWAKRMRDAGVVSSYAWLSDVEVNVEAVSISFSLEARDVLYAGTLRRILKEQFPTSKVYVEVSDDLDGGDLTPCTNDVNGHHFPPAQVFYDFGTDADGQFGPRASRGFRSADEALRWGRERFGSEPLDEVREDDLNAWSLLRRELTVESSWER